MRKKKCLVQVWPKPFLARLGSDPERGFSYLQVSLGSVAQS